MKRYLKIICLFIIFFLNNVYAIPETEDRTTLENYGVNKKWQITDNNKNNVLRTKKVNANEKIYDFKEVLSEEEKNNLKTQIDEFIEKYNMDLVILIDDLEYYYDSENEDYAADFYDYNDFGIEFEKYSGILLFRNTYEKDKYYDMYTFGNSQLYFDNNRYNDILDSIYDDLHEGRYLNGFTNFIQKTMSYIERGKPNALIEYEVDENGYLKRPRKYQIPWVAFSIISLLITTITIIILIKKNKMIKKSITAEEYLLKNSINITNRKDLFVSSHTTSYTESHDSGGSGGGFSSHSGSSGGGHSSGGGRHG